MKIVLLIAALAAACKAPKPSAPDEAPSEHGAVSPMDPNLAEKYVSGLQADVRRAQEAKEKADAANKKTDESRKALQQAEGE